MSTTPHIGESDLNTLYLERVNRAKQIPIGDKVLAGVRLFDEAAARMRDGIRSQFPNFTADQVEAEFKRRLTFVREFHERGFFRKEAIDGERSLFGEGLRPRRDNVDRAVMQLTREHPAGSDYPRTSFADVWDQLRPPVSGVINGMTTYESISTIERPTV